MRLKKTIKRMGRFFILLEQKEEINIRQSILTVDNGYSGFEQLKYSIQIASQYFPKAEISVLTFKHRKTLLEKEFTNLRFIVPVERLALQRYQIALEMFKMRKRRLDFILLLSLDMTPLLVSLLFSNSSVVLCNQWRQWWSIRLRRASEILKMPYSYTKKNLSFRNLVKKVGLFFVSLRQKDSGLLSYSVLVIDNGYATYEHIHCAVERTRESLPQAKITVLTSVERGKLKNSFPMLEFMEPDEQIFKKYKIANAMLNLRNRYDYIILLSLDITPVIASLTFNNSRVLLYNQWHQWWSIKLRPARSYLMIIPRFFYNIMLFIFLIVSVTVIFLNRSLNIFKRNLFKRSIVNNGT
jgi:hypothetical protein